MVKRKVSLTIGLRLMITSTGMQKLSTMRSPNSTRMVGLYAHNNFIGNALVLSKVDRKVRDAFYTNISWKRSGPKNNIKNGWGNIVDSIMVLRKGNPYFEVEYTSLDPVYAANSFKNKILLDIMLSPKLLVKRVVLVPDLNTKVTIHNMGFV